MKKKYIAKGLKINGIVQGVGFRPFVYQLANQYNIYGTVSNTSSGVLIHAQGELNQIKNFCSDLENKAPPLAHITNISIFDKSIQTNLTFFSILSSLSEKTTSTLISPDVCICDNCLKEMFNPEDRRFKYPFINCTNCGPRYSIIDNIPYDRPNTSMKKFKMCKKCQAEYDNPEDRRFHAQPNACHVCGPHVSLWDNTGNIIDDKNPISKAAQLLNQGCIIAVKGLGGFHLAADAQNNDAVLRLRKRKLRAQKSFALMSYNTDIISQYAEITCAEKKILNSSQRPVVLLRKKIPNFIAKSVSPENNYFGVMLPYTPLHYLLLSKYPFTALVMTSGNMSEEPIAIDNFEAVNRLLQIADYFLIHNRDIYLPSDDSIVTHEAGSMRFIRRSRGYAPKPVFLKHKVVQILACGSGLKNTICLTKGKNAFISQHIGDMQNLETYEFFKLTINHLKHLLNIEPEIIAHDLHPDYMSTRYALKLENVKKISVQHQHAHIAACMAENHVYNPVIGLAFDGTGLGYDNAVWGGEVLIASPHKFERAAHLSYVLMPGGEAAIKQPWRMAVSYLYDAFGENFLDFDLPVLRNLDQNQIKILLQMMNNGINSPFTSSLGRFFDGVAALIGLKPEISFEGQAAMEMEMLADQADLSHIKPYDYQWTNENCRQIIIKNIIKNIVQDICSGKEPCFISQRFHATIIQMFADLCQVIKDQTSLNQVILSGGVFQNSIILNGLIHKLAKTGFKVITHKKVPFNDGGISLGQAFVAAAKNRFD